jgi:hypothetical protein
VNGAPASSSSSGSGKADGDGSSSTPALDLAAALACTVAETDYPGAIVGTQVTSTGLSVGGPLSPAIELRYFVDSVTRFHLPTTLYWYAQPKRDPEDPLHYVVDALNGVFDGAIDIRFTPKDDADTVIQVSLDKQAPDPIEPGTFIHIACMEMSSPTGN